MPYIKWHFSYILLKWPIYCDIIRYDKKGMYVPKTVTPVHIEPKTGTY